MKISLFAFVCACLSVSEPTIRKEHDKIKQLPNLLFDVDFNQYSGYLQTEKDHFIHYWLVESQKNPKTDPVILWLNGGPKGSSLIGLLTENGPFFPNKDLTLFENVFAWNKFANILYLESPVGVGFSYSNASKQSVINDDTTAYENFLALKDFFTNVFPELHFHDFYIAGESYGGVYVPTLAMVLIQEYKKGTFPVLLKGFAIGNGLLSNLKTDNSIISYYYFHGLFGTKAWNNLQNHCCKNNSTGKVCPSECDYNAEKAINPKCDKAINKSFHEAHGIDHRDNIYLVCYNSAVQTDRGTRMGKYWHYFEQQNSADTNGFSCWADNATDYYFQKSSVMDALHIPASWRQHHKWDPIADFPYVAQQKYSEMNHVMERLLENNNIRVLIYNGDVDSTCNFLAAEWFVTELMEKLEKTASSFKESSRTAWKFRGEVAGFVKNYQLHNFNSKSTLDILTVKGAGHMVPRDKPGPALQMIANFVWNKPYSTETHINVDPKPTISPKTKTPQNNGKRNRIANTKTTRPAGQSLLKYAGQ